MNSTLRKIVRDRLAQIERDGGNHRLWVGTEPDPNDRLQIVVSSADAQRIPQRGVCTRRTVTVTDLLTNKRIKLARASCGLPQCFCALKMAAMKGGESYESRVRAYEKKGCTRSDAQAIVDAEDCR